jgi:hypothetical protein
VERSDEMFYFDIFCRQILGFDFWLTSISSGNRYKGLFASVPYVGLRGISTRFVVIGHFMYHRFNIKKLPCLPTSCIYVFYQILQIHNH